MHNDNDANLPARVRTMQIIAGALPCGLLGFLIVALVLSSQVPPAGLGAVAGVPILSGIAIVMFIFEAPLAFIMARSIADKLLLQVGMEQPLAGKLQHLPVDSTDARLLGIQQTVMIIRLAMFEGVGFLACIAILLEGPMPAVIVAGLCLLIMIGLFPTEGRIRERLEQQRRRLNERV